MRMMMLPIPRSTQSCADTHHIWKQYRAALKGGPQVRLRECCRESQAEVVIKSSNKIIQTWGSPFSRAFYMINMPLHHRYAQNDGLQVA